MVGAKIVIQPMNPHIHMFDDQSEEINSRSYQSLIGKLLYVISTRFNISQAVEKLNQFMGKTTKVHWGQPLGF